jgi:zinc transporter ZupT
MLENERCITQLLKQKQVLIGGTLFHLLPDIAEGSSTELNQGLTSIVLIVVSLMVMLDSMVELKNANKTDAKQPAANELQSVSPVASPSYAVAIKPSSDTAGNMPDDPRHKMSYSVLLQQPDVLVNLMGEALHNLNDGIAIATAFTLSWETGTVAYLHSILQSVAGLPLR